MQTIIVDMTPGFRMPTIYYSQGDVGTQFAIDLRSRFGDSFPTGTTVTIQATKPSGFGFSVAATSVTNGVATFTTTAEMTDEFGRFPAELKVTKTGLTLFTANFYMDGERNTHPEGTTDGSQETVIPELTQLVERVEDAASSVLDMTVNATTLAAGSQATYSYDEETNTATFGIPKGADGSLASGVLAPTYSSSSTYAVGDYVYYSGSLYRCTTAITTAEAWTSGHWTQVALAPEVSDLKSEISDIGEPANLFNPSDTFKITNASGVTQGSGYIVNSDGTIEAYGSNNNHGQRYLASTDPLKKFKAGTYTISGKITLDVSATDKSREVVVMVGYGSSVFVPLTTERGGNTQVANSAKTGYFRRTLTLDSDADFAFEVWARYPEMSSGTMAMVVSEFMIEKTADLRDYTNALYVANDKMSRSVLKDITADYNLYDSRAGYIQTNKAGQTKDGYTINSDGTITCIRSLAEGSYFLVDTNKTLKAGKYTISGKITLHANVPNGDRVVSAGLGRTADYIACDLKSSRGGTENIGASEKEGWFTATFNIAADETFAFQVIMRSSNVAKSTLPFTISNLQIESGEVLTEYSANLYQAKDMFARDMASKALASSDATAFRERTFNASYHTGAVDFASKCEEFSNLLVGDTINNVTAPSNIETFLFFTDPHLCEGSGWENRCYEFISQIQKYYNSTPTTFCLCGGDWLGNSDLPSTACFKMGYIDGFMHSMFDNCYMLVGNHDTNYQGKKDESSAAWTTRLSNQSIADLWFRKENKTYYSFNGANTKFYCFDSGEELQGLEDHDNYGYEQVAWFANSLLSDDSEHIALAVHIIYYAYDSEDLSSGIQPLTSAVLQIAEAYNNRTSITFHGATYNYSGRSGKVEFLIGGHYHNDVTGTLNGIPFVMTANVRKNESLGATFDLVLADYGNNVMKLIRVGSGSNRTISL